MRDYYSLLGVDSKATKEEIKKTYRILATKYHPDKSDDPDSAAKFIIIAEAYDVLSDKKRRAKYDLLRWEEMKRKEEPSGDFTIAVPTVESTRTRRNKAQQKRSINYHEANSSAKKIVQIVIEGAHIVGRYIPNLLGLTLLGVILGSAISHLSGAFEQNILRGVLLGVLIVAIVYGIIWVIKNVFLEIKTDLEAFSIFYKMPRQKSINIFLLIFALLLLFYTIILKIFF